MGGKSRDGAIRSLLFCHSHSRFFVFPSCLVALLAQFYPGKPPATAPLLAGCVGTYIALSLAAGGFATWVERDAFLVTRAQEVGRKKKEGWG